MPKEKRDQRVVFMASRREVQEMMKAAAGLGLTLSAWIRLQARRTSEVTARG